MRDPEAGITEQEVSQKLDSAANHVYQRDSFTLKVTDPKLIDAYLGEIQRRAQSLGDEANPAPALAIYDFRDTETDEITKHIALNFPDRGPDFASKHLGKHFVFICPENGQLQLAPIREITRGAPTTIVLNDGYILNTTELGLIADHASTNIRI